MTSPVKKRGGDTGKRSNPTQPEANRHARGRQVILKKISMRVQIRFLFRILIPVDHVDGAALLDGGRGFRYFGSEVWFCLTRKQ